jgi:hypothetical protein
MLAWITNFLLLLACADGGEHATAPTEPARDAAPAPAPAPLADVSPQPPARTHGIWLSVDDVAQLPITGGAWGHLRSQAAGGCGTPDLADQNNPVNVCVLAKALVFARTGTESYRTGVVAALRSIASSGTYNGRALALGRELAAYVIAADLINLRGHDAGLDAQFRQKLQQLRTTATSDGPKNLIACHEERPNNWGTMCGASRIAVDAYLGDKADLERAATVFRGWLGERSAYAGFKFGDLDWQCDAARPVAINPRGCTKNGRNLDGVLPEEQRRGGGFTWPAPHEDYVYEGLQGALTQAMLLSRQGYDVWNWGDRALLRAFTWLHAVNGYAAAGDDTWQPHVINRVYGTSFPAPLPARAGKIIGWTDWTSEAAP